MSQTPYYLSEEDDDERSNGSNESTGSIQYATMESGTGAGRGNASERNSRSGGSEGKPRSGNPRSGIKVPEELEGYLFTYGTQGQQNNYLRTKKALADYVASASGFKFGKELSIMVKDGVDAQLKKPDDPPADSKGKVLATDMKKFEIELTKYLKDEDDFKREKAKLFSIILNRSTPTLRDKLESMAEFPQWHQQDNVVALMETIKQLIYGTHKVKHGYWRMALAMIRIMDIKQEERESMADYAQRFGEQVEATESLWGPLFPTMTFQDIVTGGDAASEASEAEEEETAEAKLARLEEAMEAERERQL